MARGTQERPRYYNGGADNAGPENAGPKSGGPYNRGWKMAWKMADRIRTFRKTFVVSEPSMTVESRVAVECRPCKARVNMIR